MKILAATFAAAFFAACTRDCPSIPQDAKPQIPNDSMNQESTSITPFLMFTGKAEEAMVFYVSLFPNAEVEDIVRYSAGEAGPEGSVMVATFSLNGQKVMCSDSPAPHDFTFTPSTSLYVSCTTEEEFGKYVEALSLDGKALMPPDDYGFSARFAWLEDRFGVSWQLNLP